MALLLFLDTEITNQNDPKLISIGLKSANHQYYNQLKLPKKTFYPPHVSYNILPHLNDVYLQQKQLKKSLLQFFMDIKENIYVVSDEIIDLNLFNCVMENKPINLVGYINIVQYFQNMSQEVWGKDFPHLWENAGTQLITIFYNYCDLWYQYNKLPKHHAFNDASANEFAFYKTEQYLKYPIREVLNNKNRI